MDLKVIIVNNENIGFINLQKIIPWQSLGYELIGSFSSVNDALGFISENRVDVMITDISPATDGIDLVEICRTEYPEIRIILCGVDEPEDFSKKILKYENIVKYIPAPFDYTQFVSILRKVFSSITAKKSFFSSREDIDMQLHFFSNLLLGNISSKDELTEQLAILGIDIVPEETVCSMITFHIKDFYGFLNKTAKYSPIQLYHTISHLHPYLTDAGYFSLALYSYSNIAWVIIHRKPDIESTIDTFSAVITENLKSVIGVEAEISSVQKYDSILDMIIVPEASISNIEEKTTNEIIDSAIEYMDEHMAEDISLQDVAQHVFMCPAYFSSYFKKNTGKKFVDFLTDRRMTKAALYLVDNLDIPIAEICSMVGYKHLGYFFRKFKNYHGVTPAEYRKKAKNN